MSLTQHRGKRVELVSMDPHSHNISVALYQQLRDGKAAYLVHSYSRLEGTRERMESISKALKVLGQLEQAGDWLYFPCAAAHQVAAKRAFLEACKLSPTAVPQPKGLDVPDKKSGRNITVISLGAGLYQVSASGSDEGKSVRVESVVRGIKKLTDMVSVDGSEDRVAFPCGHSHDALVGLLLPRALNVRAALREEEAAGGRGMLVAPSQQK